MKSRLFATVALAAVMVVGAPALAQTGPASGLSGGPDVETVHVWGQLEESLADELAKYGSRVEVVTGEDIKKGGFDDASQALQMKVPGLYVAPKNGAFDYVNVSLLGGRRQDVIWLLDGVRISNRLYTTTTPLDTIPAHMIDKIEVLKGGQSLFYGTSATSARSTSSPRASPRITRANSASAPTPMKAATSTPMTAAASAIIAM